MSNHDEQGKYEQEEEVKQLAKSIMDEFMRELGAVKVEEAFGVERKETLRTPQAGAAEDPEFSRRMLKNAPKVKDNCIIAEKKGW